MPNQVLFDRVLKRISDDPESFAIDDWFIQTDCGTTACIAGQTALELGWTPRSSMSCEKGGEVRRAQSVAKEALDLTDAQAAELFSVWLIWEDRKPRTVEDIAMRWKVVTQDG